MHTHVVIMLALRVTSLALLLLMASPCLAQTKTAKPPLSKKIDWTPLTVKVFRSEPEITFALSTSWIPGESHKGMLRYKLVASLKSKSVEEDMTTINRNDEIRERVMKRLEACPVYLRLSDADDFEVRQIRVGFDKIASQPEVRVVELVANSFVQMDASDYKLVLNGGGWNISWGCPIE